MAETRFAWFFSIHRLSRIAPIIVLTPWTAPELAKPPPLETASSSIQFRDDRPEKGSLSRDLDSAGGRRLALLAAT